MFMRENSNPEREMAGEHFGGLMAVGTKDNLEMECKAGQVYFIEKEETSSTKEIGIMGCLMEKVLNTLKTDKGTKAVSKRTNSMETGSSTKTIQ